MVFRKMLGFLVSTKTHEYTHALKHKQHRPKRPSWVETHKGGIDSEGSCPEDEKEGQEGEESKGRSGDVEGDSRGPCSCLVVAGEVHHQGCGAKAAENYGEKKSRKKSEK